MWLLQPSESVRAAKIIGASKNVGKDKPQDADKKVRILGLGFSNRYFAAKQSASNFFTSSCSFSRDDFSMYIMWPAG